MGCLLRASPIHWGSLAELDYTRFTPTLSRGLGRIFRSRVKELELQRVIHYILYYLLLKIASVVENFYFSLLRGKIFNNSGI